MPFTVLKVPKTVDGNTEVVGEFPEEADAHKFVVESFINGLNEEHEFMVEVPPSKIA